MLLNGVATGLTPFWGSRLGELVRSKFLVVTPNIGIFHPIKKNFFIVMLQVHASDCCSNRFGKVISYFTSLIPAQQDKEFISVAIKYSVINDNIYITACRYNKSYRWFICSNNCSYKEHLYL